MARFEAVPGLEELVAAMVAPEVGRIADQVADRARRLAPPTKQWVTVADDRVRHTHVQTEGQSVPNNLRFKVPSMDWDRKHRGVGEYTYMKAPRDESSRAVANLKNCRCTTTLDPKGVAHGINTGQPVTAGNRVTVTVVCEGDLVVQAEFGDVYPGGLVATGTHFMARAVNETSLKYR
ncbi:hypothetical protein [Streptomyces sp. MJM8645]|uniref:hypothetical protein n=1 Tax=Streptomycetaceae TaxID=2062 RepID=UPI0007AFA97E|nr:hypothetical protein [Streptomyces sp. MJM8645]